MNRKQRNKLKSEMSHEIYVEENNEIIFKKLIYNPLLRILGMLILLIFSVANHNRITKLAALTSNAIFSSETILGHGTYYTILGLTIGICLLISLVSLILKSSADLSDIKILRRAYQIYSVYDFVIFVLSTFVCLFFIIMILVTPCNISGSSMENTYQDGDRVLLWNIGYSPKDGDVIVFDSAKYTDRSSAEARFYIKRIVAKEYDIVTYIPQTLSTGSLFVNNNYIELITREQYNRILFSLNLDYTLKFPVPRDKLLVFGDNRTPGGSHDSRSFGFIDESEIIGKVLFRFYPFTKIGNPDPNQRS
ncbi:MAG: signal peptidase I [Roseburia sp.]|nr:signal peptidase I [Anaeroplasma bactoclasticum]MCM1196621.1 signal peptidase I [Roseburia sp.]MCM1556656.1 signal peptidase I [Anaeroplasma bactoclasticum]